MMQSLQVFISYARKDGSPFAANLHAALEAAGFDASLDLLDIVPGEAWEERLRRLLLSADTIVYIITPASILSERCAWEIEEADRLKKRVVPVMAIAVPVQDLPPQLSRLHWIDFTGALSFGEALRQLATSLRMDADWVRMHSLYHNEAASWLTNQKPEDQLLRGTRLDEATTWLSGWKPGAPEPTDAQRGFIAASEQAEARRIDTRRQELEEKERLLKRSARAMRIAQISVGLMLVSVLAGGAYLLSLRQALLLAESESEFQQASNSALVEQLADASTSAGIDVNLKDRINEAIDASSGAAGDRAATGSSPGRGPASMPAPETSQPSKGVLGGWNIDVFACEGPGAAANILRQDRVIAALTQQQAAQNTDGMEQDGLPIGGVRRKGLAVETNARPGYNVRSDQIRAEAGEGDAANQLGTILATQTGLSFEQVRSKTRTVNYISVFLCSGEP